MTVGGDATLSTRYVWRGITRTSEPVIQPGAYVALRRGLSFLSAGVWSSFEPFEGSASDLSDTGVGVRGWGEVNIWAEYSRSAGRTDVAVGWTGYRFRDEPGAGGRSNAFDTDEIYGKVRLRVLSALQLATEIWYDLDAVDGAYIESGLDLRVPLLPIRMGPVRTLHVGFLSAWSAGQEISGSQPLEVGHFADPGLAYLELTVWSSFQVTQSWSLAPELHFQVSRDALTKRTGGGPGALRDHKLWLSVHVSWTHSFGPDRNVLP